MRTIVNVVSGFVLVGFLGGLLFGSSPQTITVGFHEDFPPYTYEENGKLVGIFPEMVREAAVKMGKEVEFLKRPWKRLIRGAEVGELDAVMPLFKTEEREAFLQFPKNGIAVGESHFFALENADIRYDGDFESLKDLKIGIVDGYSYGDEFDGTHLFIKDKTPSDEQLVKKLLDGRCDAVVGPMEVIRFYAEKIEPGASNKIRPLGPPFGGKILYLAFSKAGKHRESVQAFSDAVQTVRKEGTHRKILEKYGRIGDMAFFKEIVIGADRENYPPYCYWQGDRFVGACTELIDRAADFMGISIRYQKIEWPTFTQKAEQGEIDAVMPLFKTREREKFFFFPSEGLAAEKIFFFALTGSKVTYSGDLKDLKGRRIGVVKAYSYGKVFDDAVYLNKYKVRADGVGQLVDLLIAGKVEVIAAEKRVINYLVRKKNIPGKIKTIGPSLPREFLHLAFSKKDKGNQSVAGSFSDALRFLRRRGDYKTIIEEYRMNDRVLRLAADNRQPYYGKNLKQYGPVAEIITAAFDRMGYDVTVDFMPWAAVMEKVKKGEYDAGFAGFMAPGREKHYYFSDIIVRGSPFVFFKRIDNNVVYTHLNDLSSYHIGVVRGYFYDKDFDDHPGLKLIHSTNSEINLRNLLQGRLDLALVDISHARYLMERMAENDRNRLEAINMYPGQNEVRRDMYLLISKESIEAEQIQMDFNYGLGLVRKEGKVNEIKTRHGVEDEIQFPVR